MPHCLIEYTQGLEKSATPAEFITAVYTGACNSKLFNNDFIKSRAKAYTDYQSGSTQNDFLHVTAKILSGRTVEQKKALSTAILFELEQLLGNVKSLSITVEVVDVDKESHSQFLS